MNRTVRLALQEIDEIPNGGARDVSVEARGVLSLNVAFRPTGWGPPHATVSGAALAFGVPPEDAEMVTPEEAGAHLRALLRAASFASHVTDDDVAALSAAVLHVVGTWALDGGRTLWYGPLPSGSADGSLFVGPGAAAQIRTGQGRD